MKNTKLDFLFHSASFKVKNFSCSLFQKYIFFLYIFFVKSSSFNVLKSNRGEIFQHIFQFSFSLYNLANKRKIGEK
jgi:hypothetical protein